MYTMRTCVDCGQTKPLEEYPTRGKGGRYRSWCKVCANTRSRKNYHKNREGNAKKANDRKNDRTGGTKHRVRVYKERHCCVDCGKHYAWYQMDFDHVRGKKIAEISKMLKDGAAEWKIWSEITKCDLLCANCHRQRTFKHLGVAIWEEEYDEFQEETETRSLCEDAMGASTT